MELERRSPRGHKSSKRESEVNTQKRGTGPQGRGGKVSTRPEPEEFSSENSESESDEDDEGNDGRFRIKRTKDASREELLSMLRQKERIIMKLQAEVHSLRNKGRPNKTSLRVSLNWSGEEVNLRTACLPSCENSYFRGTSSSGMDGRTTSLIVIIACHRCACADSQFRREAMLRIFGRE